MPLVCRLRDNKDLVDPTVQSLNRLAENVIKAEALSVTITEILSGAAQAGKPLIQKADSVPSARLEAQPKRPLQRRSSNPPQKISESIPLGTKDVPDTGAPSPSLQPPLPVSPGLFYRYNRDEIYDKV